MKVEYDLDVEGDISADNVVSPQVQVSNVVAVGISGYIICNAYRGDAFEETGYFPLMDFEREWNEPDTTFELIKFNVIDTESDSGSLLLNMKVNTLSVLTLDKNGNGYISGNLNIGGGITIGNNAAQVWQSSIFSDIFN